MEAMNNWVIVERYEPASEDTAKVHMSEETAFMEATAVMCKVVSAGPIPDIEGWASSSLEKGDIVLASLIGSTRHRDKGIVYYAIRFDNVIAKL